MERSVFWTPDVLDEVRRRCDIVDIVSEHVALRRQGRNLVGRCPFHDDRSPSFSVSPDKQLYYCFGCQAAGDVFSFVMRREGLDFGEVVAALAGRVGVPLPERPASPEARQRWRQREDLYRALTAAADFYRRLLRESPGAERARRYLASRGVTGETAERFGLGYAPPRWDGLLTALGQQGFGPELLRQAGLVAGGDEPDREPAGGRDRRAGEVPGDRAEGRPHDRFRDRLMFPIRDERGQVVGFGGRVLGEGEPKYLNSPETALFGKRRLLFGLDMARAAIRETGRALVMEGYMDVVTSHQHGFVNAVASLGTALSAEQAAALRRHARQVVIAYDADAAGAQAALRGLEVARRAGCEVLVARVPAGKDPDEFLRARGGEAFREVLEGALPLPEYVFQQAAAGQDLTAVAGKVAVVRQVVPALAAEENEVARAAYINQFSARLGVPEEALRRELKKFVRSAAGQDAEPLRGQPSMMEKTGGAYNKRNAWDNSRCSAPAAAQAAAAPGVAGQAVGAAGDAATVYGRAERRLIGLLLRHPECLATLGGDVGPDDFEDEDLRRLATVVFGAAGRLAGGAGAGDAWLRLIDDPALRELAAALLMEEANYDDPSRALADCVQRLIRRRREREVAALDRTIRELLVAGRPVPPELGERWQALHRAMRGASR